jgi:signal transduction histidine kinase
MPRHIVGGEIRSVPAVVVALYFRSKHAFPWQADCAAALPVGDIMATTVPPEPQTALGLGPYVGNCVWSLLESPGRIRSANTAFAALLGISDDELADRLRHGLQWQALVGEGGAAGYGERVHEIIERGAHSPVEVELTLDHGRRIVILVTSVRVNPESDEVMSTCLDITSLANAREDWARATATKSRFLAAVSHELRTPLNTISGQTALLAEGVYGELTEKQRDVVARILRGERQLKQAVDSVLTFSRLELGEITYRMESVPLGPVVRDAVEATASQAQAKSLTVDEGDFRVDDVVLADRQKLSQIVVGLLSNAIKFTDREGRICIDVARRAEVPEFVFLRVSDTGVGIPMERIPELFEPFAQESSGTTRTAEGLGLGLTIVRDLARAMGGEVRVRSKPGQGSVFTVALRAAHPDAHSASGRGR